MLYYCNVIALKSMDESCYNFLHITDIQNLLSLHCGEIFFENNGLFPKNEAIIRFFILEKGPKTYPPADEKQRINLEWPNKIHVFMLFFSVPHFNTQIHDCTGYA